MIINNAGSRCDIGFWTKHLESTEENERAEFKEIRGLKATSLKEALLEMQEEAAILPRLKNFMYHADFNPCQHERLSQEGWDRTLEIFERERGIPEGTPRIVYEHEKHGRVHRHVIWTRLDLENMRAFPDGLDARIAHTAARKIEIELGLEKVIGPFDREPGTARPPRAPEAWEMYRAMKTGIDPRDITAEVTELYRQSQNGKEFQAALELHGYSLATGRRGLLILDSAGKEHSLAKRIEGVNTAELNAFMRDVDRQYLPTVERAKEQYQGRKIAGLEADRATVRQEIEWEEALAKAAIAKEEKERQFVEPEPQKTPAYARPTADRRAGDRKAEAGGRKKEWPVMPPVPEPIRTSPEYHFEDAAREVARNRNYTPPKELRGMSNRIMGYVRCLWNDPEQIEEKGKTLSAVLDHEGIALAKVTKEESERSHREAEFAKELGRTAPRYKEGEIVAVTEPTLEYRRNGETVGPAPRVHKLDRKAAEIFIAELDKPRQVKGLDATKQALNERAGQRAADREATRLERATDIRDFSRIVAKGSIKRTAKVGRTAARAIGQTLDAVSNAFVSLFAPTLTPEQIREGEKARYRREAEAENTIDFEKYTAEVAHQRQQQEQDREAARQRQRDGAGRER